ncbi:MAG TPA: hypothetical protein VIY48_18525 [Candidatus Paceibacterota bacterium]
MPTYRITAPDGRQFNLTGDSPPTEGELMQIYGSMGGLKAPQAPQPQTPETSVPEWGRKNPNLYGLAGATREALGPPLEAVGLGGGAALGAAGGPAGSVLGAGLGYGGVRQGLSSVDKALGNKPNTSPAQAPIDIATGAVMEAGGQVAGPIISKAAKGLGKLSSQVLGSTTGAGPAAIEGAVKGGKGFTDAMRGKISPEEVVSNTKDALNTIKENMRTDYTTRLENIRGNDNPIDMTPLKDKVFRWLQKYKVGFNAADGKLDFSNSKLPKEAATKVEDAFNDILRWDSTPGNNTAVGLDTLKQRLGNYYSDSSAARAVISDLENSTKGLILKEVPEYAKMTGNYHRVSKMVKDLEKGLMLGKGQSADQSLRRLNSAMRENFEMRLDLVKAISENSGQDVQGQVAGYAMSPLVARGLVGKLAGGGAGLGYLTSLNPKLVPVIVASSPRTVGEFLNLYGAGLRQLQAANAATGFTSIAPRTVSAKIMSEGGQNVPSRE